MAFNPFDAFRKNGKAIMALLAIVCMFTFVLSSGFGGGMDFFDWIARQFGAEDRRGPVYAEIDGAEYHRQTVEEERLQRMAANSFMLYAVDAADSQMMKQIDQDIKNNVLKESGVATALQRAMQAHGLIAQFAAQVPDESLLIQFLNQGRQNLQMAFANVNEKDKPVEYRALRRMAKILSDDERRIVGARMGLFFLYCPNTTDQDAVQFSLYLKLADKLGIKLSDDDVKRLIADETDNQLSEKDASDIEQRIRRNHSRGLSPDQLLKAIGNEYRVGVVMKVINGGYYDGRSSTPSGLTPYEFFDYYKDKCALISFDVVDVDVEQFVSRVTEKPSEQELRMLWDKYRTVEYDPAKPTPGFKEGRSVSLQFVGVDAALPFYKKSIPLVQAASTVGAGFTSTYLGAGCVPGTMEIALPHIAQPLLVKEGLSGMAQVRKYSEIFERRNHGLSLPFFFDRQSDTSTYHPLPWAGLAAQLTTALNPVVQASAATMSFHRLAELVETRDRVRLGMQMAVAPLGFNPMFGYTVVAPVFANLPASVDGVYYVQELESQRAKQPERFAQADLDGLRKKLEELRAKFAPKDKDAESDPISPKKKDVAKADPKKIDEANSEARKLVEEWIKARPGILTGKSAKPRSRYEIAEDPGLQTLVDQVKSDPLPYSKFAGFFPTLEAKETGDAQLFKPDYFPTKPFDPSAYAKPVFLGWRIEDLPAKSYNRIEQIPPELHAKIVHAWKLEKARAIATKEADAFAEEVRALAQKTLRDSNNLFEFANGLKDKAAAHHFSLLNEKIKVAPLQQQDNPHAMMQQQSGYLPKEVDGRNLRYVDTRALTREMFDVRTKPLGEVLVTPNTSRTHIYVSVLSDKQKLDVENFYRVFSKTNAPPRTEGDSLYSNYAREETFQKYRFEMLDRLKAEMKYKETDALKKQLEKPVARGDE